MPTSLKEKEPEKATATVSVPRRASDPTELLPKRLAHARPLFDPEILRRAIEDSFVKLNPMAQLKNPVMFVVEVGAIITTVFLVRDIATGAARHRIQPSDRALAVVYGVVRELRRSYGGGARQGAGRHASEDEDGFRGEEADVQREDRETERLSASRRRSGAGRNWRHHSRRR